MKVGLSESFNPLISLKFQLPNPANEVKERNVPGIFLLLGLSLNMLDCCCMSRLNLSSFEIIRLIDKNEMKVPI